MRVLIDTHVLIWHLEDDSQLSLDRSAIIGDPDNEPLVSIAGLWEIALKQSIGKLKLSRSIEDIIQIVENSTTSILAIEPSHITCVAQLPFHHKDPFDRLIIAQSIIENIPVLTSDLDFTAYGVNIL